MLYKNPEIREFTHRGVFLVVIVSFFEADYVGIFGKSIFLVFALQLGYSSFLASYIV